MVCGVESHIGGGRTNIISDDGRCSTIAGGETGCITRCHAAIGGGFQNHICASFGFIGGGCKNCINKTTFTGSSILGTDITAVSACQLHTNRLWLSADECGCGLPTTDPKVEGVVWRSGSDLKISTGP